MQHEAHYETANDLSVHNSEVGFNTIYFEVGNSEAGVISQIRAHAETHKGQCCLADCTSPEIHFLFARPGRGKEEEKGEKSKREERKKLTFEIK
jgi:hypothetical protein